ncbi:MAG: hypothetical protein COV08_01305, partial [Candidatus Vogelbacteria bacterium CG10_big_fil_rev_8_21_14_0_10_49_38]
VSSEETIPFEVTYGWIAKYREQVQLWDSFDVVHIHYGFEFEDIKTVETALDLVRSHRKPVVFTCHELQSVHGIPDDQYQQYISLILKHADAVITLTDVARRELTSTWRVTDTVVIPHGFVTQPQCKDPSPDAVPEVLFFGTLRPNRDVVTTFVNAVFGTMDQYHISWVTRPFTANQLDESARLRLALSLAAGNPRVRIELVLPLTDDEVSNRMRCADILALPYNWAGHSGQLELAYDCGLLPVVANVGFLAGQHQLWPRENLSTPDAIEVNWSDGKSWLYQARFLQGLRDALKVLPDFRHSIDLEQRKSFRATEHEQFQDSHLAVYRQVLNKEKNS